MSKVPFITKEQAEEIKKTYPTPFHIYDEKGIRENVKAVKEAFSWNKGFKEYFAVKATPNPFLLDILKEYDMGCDCSSMTELMMAKACGFDGPHIMFSSNDTPLEEFEYANELGAIINLDDFTHIEFLEKTIGYIPETISCRYNPGGYFSIANNIMDNPGDAKYGFTTEQLFEGFKLLKEKGAKAAACGFSHGDYEGNEQQLPAMFIVDEDRTINYVHYAKNIMDMPTVDEVLNLL